MKEGQYFQNDPETKHQIHIARNLEGTCHKSRAVHFCFLTSFALILQASRRSVSQGYVTDRFWGTEVIMFARSVPRSHLSVCDPLRCSPLGSSVPGTFQARILEWICQLLLQGIFLTQGLHCPLCVSCICRRAPYH